MQSPHHPSVKMLNEFAITMAIAFPIVFMLLLPWLFSFGIPTWPLIVSAGFLLLYALLPSALIWPYRLWQAFGAVMGYINTRLILGFVFFVMMTPIGWVMRVRGRLQFKQIDRQRFSAWQTPVKCDKDDLDNPF